MGVVLTLLNYVNPVCCVAIVCHQVRLHGQGHLRHFHRAISYLKWHKIVRMRCLACTFSQMKSVNMFSMFFCNLEFSDISFGDLLRFEYITSLFSCLCMSMSTSNSGGNMQKHGYSGCFHAASATEIISWVCVIRITTTIAYLMCKKCFDRSCDRRKIGCNSVILILYLLFLQTSDSHNNGALCFIPHYIMCLFNPLQCRHNRAMASQITSLTIVYTTVYSGTDQRKHQSSASLAFVRGIHR